MKPLNYTILLFVIIACMLQSCKSSGNVPFAEYSWSVYNSQGVVTNQDTSYIFTLGKTLIDSSIPLIGKSSQIQQYEGLNKYLNDIINDSKLSVDTILLYAPYSGKLFVKYHNTDEELTPSVITKVEPKIQASMLNVFMTKGEIKSDGSEIYSNTFFNNHAKRYVAVDRIRYANEDIAIISIFQTANKSTDRISFSRGKYALSKRAIDYSDREMAEIIGWDLHEKKQISIDNYIIGKQLRKIK